IRSKFVFSSGVRLRFSVSAFAFNCCMSAISFARSARNSLVVIYFLSFRFTAVVCLCPVSRRSLTNHPWWFATEVLKSESILLCCLRVLSRVRQKPQPLPLQARPKHQRHYLYRQGF